MGGEKPKKRFFCQPANGKVRHETKEEAYQTAFWVSRDEVRRGKVYAYWCPHCKGWHWGHSKRGAKQWELKT